MPLKMRLGITAVLQRQPMLSLCCVLCILKMIIDEIKALSNEKLAKSNILCSVLQISNGFSPYRYVYRTVKTTKTMAMFYAIETYLLMTLHAMENIVWFHPCLFVSISR